MGTADKGPAVSALPLRRRVSPTSARVSKRPYQASSTEIQGPPQIQTIKPHDITPEALSQSGQARAPSAIVGSERGRWGPEERVLSSMREMLQR